MKFRIGTRGSKLAMWQAKWVRNRLESGGHECEIIPIETRGDRILEVSISKIGSKGVFTEEIEQHLREERIDIAVHSAKDMQSVLDDGFELIAFSEREQENDVLVSNEDLKLEDVSKIGTSSTRRGAFLSHYFPGTEVVPVRGNLQTRLRKMDEGLCDGLLLAYAGVHRMGQSALVREMISTDQFTPAVGQGSMAVECFRTLPGEKREAVKELVNHVETAIRIKAERSFLRTLEGGCSIPVFALAEIRDSGIALKGGIISLDGKHIIRETITGPADKAEQIGEQLGKFVLESGGKDILEAIRNHPDH